ncbi:MAG TPA: LptF/LptG family permease, partial [Allosphingosinicella sp.]|nr:LptF/LptG family permease [Allosphingosinicella sp.]
SYGRLLVVPYAYALVLLVVNFGIVGYVQPYAQYQYQSLRFELRSGALGASIKVGEFTNIGRRMTLRVERSENRGTDLYGVFARLVRRDGRSLAVTADRGTFLSTDDPDTILFRLRNGRMVHNAPGYRTPRVLSFVQHDLPIELPTIESFRGRGNLMREMTIPELARRGWSAAEPRQRRLAIQSNLYFRLVEVAMMLLVPMLAVSLAVPPKRSASGLGIFLAIAFVVTYHKVNQNAEWMGALGRVDPLIALWVPFLIFGGLIVWMYHTLAHRPGGQPIGALERGFAWISARVRRLVRRRRPRDRHGLADAAA